MSSSSSSSSIPSLPADQIQISLSLDRNLLQTLSSPNSPPQKTEILLMNKILTQCLGSMTFNLINSSNQVSSTTSNQSESPVGTETMAQWTQSLGKPSSGNFRPFETMEFSSERPESPGSAPESPLPVLSSAIDFSNNDSFARDDGESSPQRKKRRRKKALFRLANLHNIESLVQKQEAPFPNYAQNFSEQLQALNAYTNLVAPAMQLKAMSDNFTRSQLHDQSVSFPNDLLGIASVKSVVSDIASSKSSFSKSISPKSSVSSSVSRSDLPMAPPSSPQRKSIKSEVDDERFLLSPSIVAAATPEPKLKPTATDSEHLDGTAVVTPAAAPSGPYPGLIDICNNVQLKPDVESALREKLLSREKSGFPNSQSKPSTKPKNPCEKSPNSISPNNSAPGNNFLASSLLSALSNKAGGLLKPAGAAGTNTPRRSQKSLACEFGCGYETPDATLLKSHHVSHSNDRPYHCGYCGHAFKRNHTLLRHIRQVHKMDTNTPERELTSSMLSLSGGMDGGGGLPSGMDAFNATLESINKHPLHLGLEGLQTSGGGGDVYSASSAISKTGSFTSEMSSNDDEDGGPLELVMSPESYIAPAAKQPRTESPMPQPVNLVMSM